MTRSSVGSNRRNDCAGPLQSPSVQTAQVGFQAVEVDRRLIVVM